MEEPSTSKEKPAERTFPSELLGFKSDGIELRKLIEDRASEIAMTIEDVKKKLPKLCSQQVPKHMRRRSVSHNPKRLPRRMQEKAQKEASATKKNKRPSRKFRRRASNLLEEFGRRQRPGRATWLETHVWHAKRFVMGSFWGYKLPIRPNDKGARAMHRATTQHSLIHDISYYCCIEVKGRQEDLLEGLSKLCSQETGLTFGAKIYLQGTREGNITLYCANKYPYEAIGPVRFLWKPVSVDEHKRQLWIWTHPASCGQLIAELGIVLGLNVENLILVLEAQQATSDPVKDSERKVCFGTEKPESTKKDVCSSDGNHVATGQHALKRTAVQMSASSPKLTPAGDAKGLLKPALKRKAAADDSGNTDTKKIKFDNGIFIKESNIPSVSNENFTLQLLKNTLVRFSLQGPKSNVALHDVISVADNIEETTDCEFWWQKYYGQSDSNRESLRLQSQLWKQQGMFWSPACLAPGTVITLTVQDPRLKALPKTKANPDQPLEKVPQNWTQKECVTPSGPIWNQQMRDAASNCQIPQKTLNILKAQLSPLNRQLNLGNKEDRIPVMLLQQPGMDKTGYGSGWDLILPRSWAMPFWISLIYRGVRVAGLEELHRACIDHERPLFPDHFPDSKCGSEHQELQRKKLMEKHFRYPPNKRPNFQKLGVASPFAPPWKELVQEWSSCAANQNFYVLRNKKVLSSVESFLNGRTETRSESLSDQKYGDALVCVSIICLFKGVPSEFASLCMLEEDDFFNLRYLKKPSGPSASPKKKGVTLLKEKLKTKRAKEFIDQRPKIEGLLMQCERKPVGYLEEGRFSFLKGQAVGLGFCAFRALMQVGETCKQHGAKPTVLVRGQNSLQFRFAEIKIVL